jgi:hypothetical protein
MKPSSRNLGIKIWDVRNEAINQANTRMTIFASQRLTKSYEKKQQSYTPK